MHDRLLLGDGGQFLKKLVKNHHSIERVGRNFLVPFLDASLLSLDFSPRLATPSSGAISMLLAPCLPTAWLGVFLATASAAATASSEGKLGPGAGLDQGRSAFWRGDDHKALGEIGSRALLEKLPLDDLPGH